MQCVTVRHWKEYTINSQQDAHEFICFLLNSLHEEVMVCAEYDLHESEFLFNYVINMLFCPLIIGNCSESITSRTGYTPHFGFDRSKLAEEEPLCFESSLHLPVTDYMQMSTWLF